MTTTVTTTDTMAGIGVAAGAGRRVGAIQLSLGAEGVGNGVSAPPTAMKIGVVVVVVVVRGRRRSERRNKASDELYPISEIKNLLNVVV